MRPAYIQPDLNIWHQQSELSNNRVRLILASAPAHDESTVNSASREWQGATQMWQGATQMNMGRAEEDVCARGAPCVGNKPVKLAAAGHRELRSKVRLAQQEDLLACGAVRLVGHICEEKTQHGRAEQNDDVGRSD